MRTPLRLLVVIAVGALGLVVSTGTSADTAVGSVTPGVSFAATDQVIVKMRPGDVANLATLGRAAGKSVGKVRSLTSDMVVLRLPDAQSGAALRATVNAMARVQGVEWVEPDVRMTTQTSDPLFGDQWDLGPAGPSVYGIDLEDAWSALPAIPATVNVAVVDTGYVAHADLGPVILPGYDFIDDPRIANDGDGRDADASDPGDWITNQESRRGFFRGCQAGDSSWHGTHVAGTIAATTDNGKGIAGINPHAKIVPVRVLGKCGGYTSDITDGVRWAAGLAVTGTPPNPNIAKVVNLSLGGSGACSSTWQTAIDAVTAAGTTVVVAAGNSNSDAAGFSPASCNGVVTVASTGQAGSRAYYSNYGATVEIAAPGGDKNADAGDTILSTLNTGATSAVASPAGDTYVRYQGTSMASPHVAGVVSLMLSTQPGLAPAQIRQLLQQSATPFPSGSSCSTATCGDGIVNAAAAVIAAGDSEPPVTTQPPTTTQPPAGVPGAFDKLSPAPNTANVKKSVELSWEPSSGATGYMVCIEIDLSPDGVCDSFTHGPYTGSSVRFVGLASGSTYEWQVRADNAGGSTVANDVAWFFSTR